MKLGDSELDVRTNSAPRTVEELNNLPIKQVGGTTIYLRDVATASDGFALQTNVVRQDGHRGVLMSILKAGNASTLSVVSGVKSLLPRVASIVPPTLKMTPLADQSIFVRSAVSGVIREAVIAAALTGLMILLFLGSWRSTLIIAVSIPLSILTSIILISLLGETINIMTLGGLALAVGILVDDATVTIENIERMLKEGRSLHDGILEGAAQIAVPALVSTSLHLYRISADVSAGRCRTLFVRAAGRGGGFRDVGILRPLPDIGTDLGDVSAKGESSAFVVDRTSSAACSAHSSGALNRCGAPIDSLLTGLVANRKLFVPGFLGNMSLRALAAAMVGSGFLS